MLCFVLFCVYLLCSDCCSEYLKREDQLLMCRAATWTDEGDGEDEEDDEDKQANDAKVLVLHPGSQYLRIGLAADAFPRTIPNVIAHPHRTDSHDCHVADIAEDEDFDHAVQTLEVALRARLRLSKRRTQSNARELVIAYNQNALPEAAEADAAPEWTDVGAEPAVFVGQKALLLPPDALDRYTLYWPVQRGVFNTYNYASPRQCIDDVAAILVAALGELGMQRADWTPLAVVLVIPDVYDKCYVEAMLDILIRVLQFSKVCVLQESVCTVFGAGLSAACVVDVGAQTTSVACVEEGICIPESRIQLPYGGDDVTRLFIQLLQRNAFPYKIDLRRIHDWQLADTLKVRYCTSFVGSATVQLLDFVHTSSTGTHRYRFKAYDEPVLATMAYFFPAVFHSIHPAQCVQESRDLPYRNSYKDSTHAQQPEASAETLDTPSADTGHSHPMPLDDAIIQSIMRACEHAPSDDRLKTMCASILLVGGGHAFPGFIHVLEDRLRARQPATAPIRFLSPSRDTDPQMLAWKGACVFSQLKIARDFWIKQRDWDLLGVRCLQYRSLGYFWNG